MAARQEPLIPGMAALIPPRLSSRSASSWGTPKTSSDAARGRVDGYFPEVLVQDLKLSGTVFASKSMTAGAPALTLSHADEAGADEGRLETAFAVSAKAQVPRTVRKRNSMVSFLDDHESPPDEAASEADSRSSFHTEGMTFRSVRHRESVMTTATSLASINWKPSLHKAADGVPCESSWIDGDSDGETDDDDDDDDDDGMGGGGGCDVAYHMRSLSPRPPTPPGPELGSGAPGLRRIDTRGGRAKLADDFFHRKSHSICGGCPLTPSARDRPRASLMAPMRPSSTTGVRPSEAAGASMVKQQPAATRPDTRAGVDAAEPGPRAGSKAERVLKKPLRINAVGRAAEVPDADACMMSPAGGPLTSPLPTKTWSLAQSPPGRPGLRSVQSWLNSSLQPYPHALNNEDLTRVVPLPPDAMETLRVSIACFPETMLLSSSLTIETIRTYSRKVRQPSLELLRSPPSRLPTPESPTPAPARRSLWRNLMPYMKSPITAEARPRYNHSSGQSSIDSTAGGAAEQPKPWEPLKNVFGCCSDYICDALYAHVVAYIYVSALVARNPPAPAPPASRGGRGGRAHATGEGQQDDIPKKAASLLGLGGTSEAAGAAGFGRMAKRPAPPPGLGAWTREEMVTTQQSAAASAGHENMQSGLLRCIRRLVATAKLMAESGTGEETVLSIEAEDADMVFVRSLCEIVRMAEEGG